MPNKLNSVVKQFIKVLDDRTEQGKINGKQEYATADQIKALKNHIITFKNYKKDLRVPLREIEKALLTEHAGELIGNQCIDFQKQDGITEVRSD